MRGFGRLDVLTTPSTCWASMRLRPMPPATAATPIVPALAIRKRRRVHSGEATRGQAPASRVSNRMRHRPSSQHRPARRHRGRRLRAESVEQEAQGHEPRTHRDGRVGHGEDWLDERRPDGGSSRHDAEHHEDSSPQSEPPCSEDARHGRKGNRDHDHEDDERGLVVRAEQRYDHVLRAGRLEVDRERPDGHDERRRAEQARDELRGGQGDGSRGRTGQGGRPTTRCGALLRAWSWRHPTGPV